MLSSLITKLAMAPGDASQPVGENVVKAAEAADKAANAVAPVVPPTAAQGFEPQPLDAIEHQGSYWMPREGATFTDSVDWLFYGILGLTIFCFVAITVAVVYLTWRDRARPGHKAEESTSHSDSLEITWTVIPSIICVFIFIWGWRGFVDLQTTPPNVMDVQVTAQKWKWIFEHEGLDLPVDALHVPVDKPVRLVMRSEDVLHSFYVPAFRTKQDVIPYRYSYVWFEATDPGVYRLYCAEYCGTGHSAMKTIAVVHGAGERRCKPEDPAETKCCDTQRDPLGENCSYDQWINGYLEGVVMSKPPAARGEFFYNNLGCKNCHSIDGSSGKGPTFKGLWGSTHGTNKGARTVDHEYVRESIVEPPKVLHEGYGPIMPNFAGKLTDEQIDWIIKFLITLK